MATNLQKQLQTRLEAKNLSINALEKQAGLRRSAVRNIILGFSKKPSAEVLSSIASILECSVDDLIGRSASTPNKFTPTTGTHPWNEKLFIDAIKATSKALHDKQLDLKLEQVLAMATETYKYSLGKKSEHIDKDFINWLVGRG